MINFTKVIIPFKTNKNYFKDGVDVKIKYEKESKGQNIEKIKDKWLSMNMNCQYLLENVAHKITNEENPGQIGKTFILNNEIKYRLGFPKNGSALFFPRGFEKGININFGQVCLHFFETNVGFCEIEFLVDSDNVDDYVNANYFLSELKSTKNFICYEEKRKDGVEQKKLNFSEIINNIFEGLEGLESFENDGQMSFVDKKPLIYGYCFVKNKETMKNTIDIAKHNYKSSYKVINGGENFSFFDNSLIGASDLGVVNISCETEDEETNSFFKTTYVTNFKNQYFYLYLLLLNEKYTLTKRLSQYSALSSKKNISSKESCEQAMTELNKMLNKNLLTKVRCDDSVVSLTPQIQGYFDYLKKTFEIEKLLNLVDYNNKQISEMMQVYTNYLQEIKNKEIRKKENRLELNKLYIEIVAFIITNVIGTLTIFNTILEVMQKFNNNLLKSWLIIIPIAFSAIFAIAITFQIITKIKSAKLVKQKMEEE